MTTDFIILEMDDIHKYLKKSEKKSLAKIIRKVQVHRETETRTPNPFYHVKEITQDEETLRQALKAPVDKALDPLEEELDEGGF